MRQFFTTVLKQLPVLNPGRTDLFTRAATETPIDVRTKGLGCIFQPPLSDRPHQVKPPTWSIILVASDYIGRTRLKTQPTMNAGKQLFFLSG